MVSMPTAAAPMSVTVTASVAVPTFLAVLGVLWLLRVVAGLALIVLLGLLLAAATHQATQHPANSTLAGAAILIVVLLVLLVLELALDEVGGDRACRASHNLAHGAAVADLATEEGATSTAGNGG